MNVEKLKEVLSIQSVSHNQFRMFSYIIRYIQNIENVSYYTDNGNIYITKSSPYSYSKTYDRQSGHRRQRH